MSSAATDTTDAARRQIPSVSQRRQNKPLIEKRRRARINECLLQLKGLLMKDLGKETPRQNKLEKADILEMTVDYIKKISYNSLDQKSSAQTSPGAPFVDGFSRCLEEVDTFLDRQLHLQAEVRHKVLAHCKQQLTDKGGVLRGSQDLEPDIKEEGQVEAKVQDDREPETFSKTSSSVRDKEFVEKDSSAVDLSRLVKKRSQNRADLSGGETDDSQSTEDVKAGIPAVDDDVGHLDRREKRARLSDSGVCGVDASDDNNESRSTVRILCEGLNREEARSPSSSASPRSQCSVETAETVFAAKGLSASSAESPVSAATHAATSERLTQPHSETSNNAIKLAGPLKLFCGGNVFILVDHLQQQQQQQQQQSQLQQQQHSYFKFSQSLQPPASPHIQPIVNYLPQPSLLSANSSSLSSCVSGTSQPYFLASGADVPVLSSLANVTSCVMEPSSFLAPISTPTVTSAQVTNSAAATSSAVLGAGGQRFVYGVYPSNAALGVTSPTLAAYLPNLQHLNVGLTGTSAFPSLAYQAPSLMNQAVVPAKGLDLFHRVGDSLFAGGALTAQGELTGTVGAQNDNVNTVTELSSLSGSPQPPFHQFSEGVLSGRENDVNNNSTSLVSHGHSSMWRPW